MKGRRTGIWSAVACALLLAGAAAAESGVALEPGKWSIETTTKNSMQAQPTQKTATQCIEEGQVLKPEELMADAESCSVSDVASDGSEMRWTFACQVPAGSSQGKGRFASSGPRADGEMEMQMQMGGQSFTFSIAWSGERIGSCD